ncbi:MAG: DUF1287 domain-containing protein [Planktomarina sp.]
MMFSTHTVLADTNPIVAAARMQVGQTVIYDPAYVGLAFPGGDVDRRRGVCSDVVIRALRDAHGFDLQLQVNTDMKQNFAAYPANWGLTRPDKNIDHRRVHNLRRFFERRGEDIRVSDNGANYQPGDIVSWRLPGNLTHIGVVSDRLQGTTPLIIHNIGAGTQEEDILFMFEITGHFRSKL